MPHNVICIEMFHFVQHDKVPQGNHRVYLVLRKKGKARMELAAEIREVGELAVAFSGRYVVQRS